MIELELEDAVNFKRIVDAIAVLIDEAEFILTDKGFALKATDPSQISMVDFVMEKDAFRKFSIKQPTKLGLDLAYLAQIMSRAKAKDSLHLILDPATNRLNISFQGASVRKFSVPLIDISASELPSPKIDFDAEVTLDSSILTDGLKDASLISTHVTLGIDAERFYMSANSSKGTLDHETKRKEKAIKDFHVKKECKSMFPLDYLINMLKGTSSDTAVKIQLKSNAPIRLSYNIGKSQICYFLAPRIEAE